MLVARYHSHCHRALELRPATLLKALEALDAFRRPERFEQFLTACEADARGRTGLEDRAYPQPEYLRRALRAAQSVDAGDLIAQGLTGAALGSEIGRLRLEAIKDVLPPEA